MIGYYKCIQCGFMQTEKPYWLDESYSFAISDMDTGILVRNQLNVKVTKKLISTFFNSNQLFLDYGGGHGIFTRLMRDKGYNYFTFDKYCDPILTKPFEVKRLEIKHQFELITALELFEHVEMPITKLKELFEYTDNVFISTTLQPNEQSKLKDWHYLVPEAGQHISFYTLNALKYMASQLNVNLVSNGYNYHLFSKSKINSLLFKLICSSKTNRFIPLIGKRKSLTFNDFELIQQNNERN